MTTRLVSISAQPLTTADAKLHLRVEHADEDDLIDALIAAASDMASQATGRAIASATYELRIDEFPPDDGEIRLLWPPIVAVSSITYADEDGNTQVLSTDAYVLDSHSEPAWILRAADTEWPATYETANAVRIIYTAGYGTSCPESIKQWMLLQIGHWYRNRESVNIGNITSTLDYVDGLLDRWRVY